MAEQDAAVHEVASQQLPVAPAGGTPPLVAPQEAPSVEENRGEAEGREGAVSPQFSTTSTLSGDIATGNPFLGSDISLDRTPAPSELSRVPQTLPNGAKQSSPLLGATGDPRGDIVMEITEIPEGSEAIVATTAGTWEKFEPATSKGAWEVFDNPSGEGGRGGKGVQLGAGKEEGEEEEGAEGVIGGDTPKKLPDLTEATSAPVPSREVKRRRLAPGGPRGRLCSRRTCQQRVDGPTRLGREGGGEREGGGGGGGSSISQDAEHASDCPSPRASRGRPQTTEEVE